MTSSVNDNGPGLSRAELRRRIDHLGTWFHNIELDGVETAPDHPLGDYPTVKWERFADAIADLVEGRSVLDIGCNAGFYSIAMKRLGARRVVGIDSDERYLAQARFAAEVKGAEIEFQRLSVYDVAELGERFDIILFMGVLYHLRHPLLALDRISEHVASDILVFQSMLRGSERIVAPDADYPFSEQAVFSRPGWPRLAFVEKRYAGDPTNWWVPNLACAEAMLRSSGFDIEARPEAEVFVCRHSGPPAGGGI